MNSLSTFYRKAGNGLSLILLATVLIPLIALSFYNHPSPADDYGYIDTVFKFGWPEAMHYYYTGWTGRYFGIFLNHSNPLLFHSVEGFKVLPILLFLGLTGALYLLVRELTPTLPRLAHLGMAGVVLFLYILAIPSIAEAFYWMAAFVTYTIPSTLTFCWVVVVIRWYRLETPGMKFFTGVFAGFLVFAIIGSSEPNLLTILILIAALWGYRLLFHKQVDGLMLGVLAAAALGCFLYFTAPGLTVRLGGNPLGGNIPKSILSSFTELAFLTFGWLRHTPLLPFTALWVVVLSRITPQARARFAVPFWYVGLVYLGILSAQLFTSYYGIGIDPTAREINCVYLFFLVGWFYTTGVLFEQASRRFSLSAVSTRLQQVVLATVALWTIFSIYRNPNLRLIYGDWLSGKAAAYNTEMYHRYDLIKESSDSTVYLPAIKNLPRSLFVDDIKANHDHWWNKLMAGYFGKKAIYLQEEEPKDE